MTEELLQTKCTVCGEKTVYKVVSYIPEEPTLVSYYCKSCDWSVDC